MTTKTIPLAIILAAALLQGCETTSARKSSTPLKAYAGRVQPAENLAVVECSIGTQVRSTDGNKEYTCEPLTSSLSVLPGEHTFEVWLKSQMAGDSPTSKVWGGTWKSQQAKMITFEAKAGFTYKIYSTLDKEDRYKSDGWSVAVVYEKGNDEGWIIHPNKSFVTK